VKRVLVRAGLRVAPAALAIAAAAVVGLAILLLLKRNPLDVAREVRANALNAHGLRDELAYILFNATPLILTGLAVAVAFRAGLFNIGASGQILVASLTCGLAAWKLSALPGWLLFPACLAAAAAAGAAWGAVAGALKAWRGSHEVIVTIMLNFVAVALTEALSSGPWKDRTQEMAQLPDVASHARLARLGTHAFVSPDALPSLGLPFPASVPVSTAFFLALACAIAVWVWLERTTRGYELRATGHNPEAARAAGISVRRVTVLAMAVSGALAGLASIDLVLGYKGRFSHHDALGYSGAGFVGIAVCLMGRSHPAGIVAAALLFGALRHLGLLFETVPRDLILILQGATVLFVVCADVLFRRWLQRRAVA
jgi:simple sugar transport system permease protein